MTVTQKPPTFIADVARLPRALQFLTLLDRWVVWRWVRKSDGKWTKPPFKCRAYRCHARVDDPSTWGSYADAFATVKAGHADGIGIMLKDSELAVADLDHIRDAQTGALTAWAQELCAEADDLGLYREVTASGCGLRFIGLMPGGGSELHRKFTVDPASRAGLELFRNCNRFITVSGLQEGDCESMGEIGDYLDALAERFDGRRAGTAPGSDTTAPPPGTSLVLLDLNTAGPQPRDPDYYRDLIENGAPKGGRGAKFQGVIWHLASQGWSIDEIAEELARHPGGIGEKYGRRLRTEVTRSFNKWQRQRQAGVGAAPAAPPGAGAAPVSAVSLWPQIRIKPGELPRVVSEAEKALLALARDVYQRGGLVVRPILDKMPTSSGHKTASWRLKEVTRRHLTELLCCAAQFLRYNKKERRWAAIDAPDKVADAYLHREGHWHLPALVGVAMTPFLRTDGSVCENPGYDVVSCLLYKPETQVFPPVPQMPNKAEAIAALARLKKLIATFPFVADADRSVTLAGFLTALDRRSMATAPLFGFTAPAARTGKSLLVDLINILAAGQLMPVLSQGQDEQEFEKRLGASLLAGDACISIDNCDAPLSGPLLCQALTQTELDIRLLGHSRNVRTPSGSTIFATGNNLEVAGDLADRCLIASLDAKAEQPGLRRFAVNVKQEARIWRGELVVAALTVLRAWRVAWEGGERVAVDPFGGFEEWSHRIREALVWLGEPDPCGTVAKVRDNDPERERLAAVVAQWAQYLKLDTRYTIQDVVGRAIGVTSFFNALSTVAGTQNGNSISNERLGRWLRRVEGKIVNGYTLFRAGILQGSTVWELQRR
jgi:hypothetical protein